MRHEFSGYKLTVDVDITKCELTNDGIPDFYWPASHPLLIKFGDKLVSRACDLFCAYGDRSDEIDSYRFLSKYFFAETCAVFQGDFLRERFQSDGVNVRVPDHWKKWPYLFSENSPPMPEILSALKLKGSISRVSFFYGSISRLSRIFKNLKLTGSNLEIDGLRVGKYSDRVAETSIVATQRTPLIRAHAQQVDTDVFYFNSKRWFSEIGKNTVDLNFSASDKRAHIATDLLSIASDLYRDFGVDFKPHASSYLQEFLIRGSEILQLHFSRLMLRTDLPLRLWTGSGGNIWDLMLRRAVMIHGGHVTGHDHGGGSCHVDMPVLGTIEMWACDEYFTFNKRQQVEISSAVKKWPLLEKKYPEISYAQKSPFRSDESDVTSDAKIEYHKKNIKNVLLLSTIYDGDRGRTYPHYADLAYVDWQARIVSKLKDWGYNVLIKPHPESPVLPPNALVERFGANLLEGKFEDALASADLIIFDYTYTSVFFPSLSSKIPIVIIDFEQIPWYGKAFELASLRCEIIRGYYDSRNRLDVDWTALKESFGRAYGKRLNRDLVTEFFL